MKEKKKMSEYLMQEALKQFAHRINAIDEDLLYLNGKLEQTRQTYVELSIKLERIIKDLLELAKAEKPSAN